MAADPDAPRRALAAAVRVVVLTGAGMSAESGVPTFRGSRGLWRDHRPEDLATPEAFERDPRLVWEWYAMRRQLVAGCEPNAGHEALAAWCLDRPGERTLVTQNVDGLHERAVEAAAAPEAVPEGARPLALHGSLRRLRCVRCSWREDDDRPIDATSEATLPRCPACERLARPDVVWFGEALDPDLLARAFAAAGEADVCLVVGTSAVVHPAASVPLATMAAGGVLIEVNPEPTPLSARADHRLAGPAATLLPELLT